MKKLLVFLGLTTSLFAKSVIVFDYGGVLATADKNEVRTYMQERLSLSSTQVHELVKEVRKQRKKSCSEAEAWKRGAKVKNVTLPDNFAEELEAKYLSAVQKRPHMMELVDQLKEEGYRVAMLSNISKREAVIVRKLGFYDPFDPVLLSNEIGISKPHARAFEILIERLGVPPQEIIFIDDQEQNIKAAEKLGIDGIQFISFDQLQIALKERLLLSK